LKAYRADDPFENVGFRCGDLCLEIGLGRQLALRRLAERFGQSFSLLWREMAFVPQSTGKAERIEENRRHFSVNAS
jgi:hypothetical protein